MLILLACSEYPQFDRERYKCKYCGRGQQLYMCAIAFGGGEGYESAPNV